MNDNEIAFCSVAFGDIRYLEQLQRLKTSIEQFHPESSFFYFINEMPPGAKSHYQSAYGFKVHAINFARLHGYTKIIFFDPAVYLVSRVDKYFDIVKDYGVVAAQDDNLLCNYCADEIYNHYGVTREESKEQKQHLVGGSIYALDFDMPLCNQIFNRWAAAENVGMFNYPRNDESNMALSLYTCGSRPTPYDICRYDKVPNPLCVKEHFK